MKTANTKPRPNIPAITAIALSAATLLLICLAVRHSGLLGCMEWLLVPLGAVWLALMPSAMLRAAIWILKAYVAALRRWRDWRQRRRISRSLWATMHRLTLNGIAPIYGIKPEPGEDLRRLERRILKAARTVDTVNLSTLTPGANIKPATGTALDAVAARRHVSPRKPGETDEQLQERIRAKVLADLEGGAHGVQS